MPSVLIEGAGIAGRVLRMELARAGVPSRLEDRVAFPREKVCGGILQWDSWNYLKENFRPDVSFRLVEKIAHYWRGRLLGRMRLSPPAVFVRRFALDTELETSLSAVDDPVTQRVDATGAAHQNGEWIGFETRLESPVSGLHMHYGRGICLGIAPTPERDSHVAFVVRRSCFQDLEDLRGYVRQETGVTLLGALKGTGRIGYQYFPGAMAIGDAKLTTFPFLGLGMKHAIDSARLMARCLTRGEPAAYENLHKRLFWRQRAASSLAAGLYDSPMRWTLLPFVTSPFLFRHAYRWVHGAANSVVLR